MEQVSLTAAPDDRTVKVPNNAAVAISKQVAETQREKATELRKEAVDVRREELRRSQQRAEQESAQSAELRDDDVARESGRSEIERDVDLESRPPPSRDDPPGTHVDIVA